MNKLLNIILLPLDILFLLISLLHIILVSLLKRYIKVKADLKSFIPISIHKFKVWRKYKNLK